MADDPELARLRADLAEANSQISDLKRRVDFHDQQLKTHAGNVENVMGQAKAVTDAQQQVTAAKTAFDKLSDRVDAVETTTERVEAKVGEIAEKVDLDPVVAVPAALPPAVNAQPTAGAPGPATAAGA